MSTRDNKRVLKAVREWRSSPRQRSKVCTTCMAPPVVKYALDEFFKDRARGETGSMAQFFRMVLVPLGYRGTLHALMRHLQSHEPRWNQ